MGGQVQIMFAVAPAVIGLIKSGKLKAISISSAQRYKLLPEIPTIAEQGFPEFIYVGWNGIHVPTKTPSEIIQKLSSEINKIMSQTTILPRIDSAGFETFTGNIKDFENFQQQDINRIRKIVKEANIKPD
jgi:tripartite-type tricarboxylate transporter receptor subunit TctC